MKYKLKTIPKLLLCFAFLILTNCSKEEFVDHIKTSKRNNEITFEQFKNEMGLYDFSNSIHINPTLQPTTSVARLANGNYELSDFDISTDIIKKLESVNITSYTFRIFPKEYRKEDVKKNLQFITLQSRQCMGNNNNSIHSNTVEL